MKFLNIEAKPLAAVETPMTLLLWGKSGCGKTVLASTLPKPILLINVDPQGYASIQQQDGVTVLDLSGMQHTHANQFKEGEMADTELRNLLKQNPQYQSIVFDSVTSFAQHALSHMVLSGKAGRGTTTNPVGLENPGQAGYGGRNRITLSMVRMLLRIASEYKKHLCFICHEDTPTKDKEGVIESITVMLGGSLPEEVPLQISEVWHILDDGKRRIIGIRPYAKRAPMRSRMFDTRNETTFEWRYDVR